jgi:hypothetical protein
VDCSLEHVPSLRDLLLNAARRFRREGGDPVVELQTNFGGGKTHLLIALFHLAAGYRPHELSGVEAMLAAAGLDAPPAASTAVLVGQMISPLATVLYLMHVLLKGSRDP